MPPDPIVSLTFFLLVALSGLWFPLRPGSGLATFSNYFPVRHLITGVVGAFNGVPGYSPWKDVAVMAIWGLAGAVRGVAALAVVASTGMMTVSPVSADVVLTSPPTSCGAGRARTIARRGRVPVG